MKDSLQVGPEEAWHLSYNVFAFTLEALAAAPEDACQLMGDYNTAWELQHDALGGSYLLSHGRLSVDQEASIVRLLEYVRAVPARDLPGGPGRAPNLGAMQHPSWTPVRWTAGQLLAEPAAVSAGNRAYLGL